MGYYKVENQWGGSSEPWHEGGTWLLGTRTAQNVVQVNISSTDGGITLSGTITYFGEGPIGFRGTLIAANQYSTENQWGGSSAPWHPGGMWVLGSRATQNLIAANLVSTDGGQTFDGSLSTITYVGEGPIGFRATYIGNNQYTTENQWGGSSAPWHPGGMWTIGARSNQLVTNLNVSSPDGIILSGTNTYSGEGPIGFRGVLL